MQDKELINSLANTLISQYGDDAEAVAMMRAAEYAAALNNDEWVKWEKVIVERFPLEQNRLMNKPLSFHCKQHLYIPMDLRCFEDGNAILLV